MMDWNQSENDFLYSEKDFNESREILNTEEDDSYTYDYPLYLKIWVTVLSSFVFAVGVTGNILVPILVWKNKQLRHSTNIFLLNLAVADVLILLICLPTALVELYTIPNTWVLGTVLCRVVPFVEISVSRASIFTLTIISIERYLAICKPMRTTSLCTKYRALTVCIAIWPVSFLAASPVLISTKHEFMHHPNGQNESVCYTSVAEVWMSNYYLVSAGIFFLLPLVFLSSIYFLITKRLLSQRARATRKSDDSQWKSRKQVAAMLGAVVCLFFVSLLPFQIFIVWVIQAPSEHINSLGPHVYFNLLFACRILVYVNSAANPIIYNAMSAKFRKALLNLFAKPKESILRRHSTFNTTSSLLSRTSSLNKRSNSLSLRRTLSDAHLRRGTSRFRSASFASSRLKSKDVLLPDRSLIEEKLLARKIKLGAYFSSGSNCSSLNEVPLKTFNIDNIEHSYRERINSLPNSPLITKRVCYLETKKCSGNKQRTIFNTKHLTNNGNSSEFSCKNDVPCGGDSSKDVGANEPKMYLKYKILTSLVQ